MQFFLPHIQTVQPISPIATSDIRKISSLDISAPISSDFKKIYFEELITKCYKDNGNLDTLTDVARIHHEEFSGIGGSKINRYKVFFNQYNVMVSLEDHAGRLFIKAA